ncbi:MAG: hypothetical protein RLZZ200_2745 [Pseudomonadota bacterium]|jgi:hypothetical protein
MRAFRVSTFTRAACVGLGLVLLSGCSHLPWRKGASAESARIRDCNKPQGYEDAVNNPTLRVPAGLDPLNSRSALRIPDQRDAGATRDLVSPCIEEPPQFANNVRLLPPVLNKQQRKERIAREKAQFKAQEAEAKRKRVEEKRKRAEEKAARKAARAKARQAAKDATSTATP